MSKSTAHLDLNQSYCTDTKKEKKQVSEEQQYTFFQVQVQK